MPRATGRRSVVPMIHTVNGVGLYVEEHGEGSPILCIHGSRQLRAGLERRDR